jgi:peptide/nickel transport system substrate-binding protein
MRRAILAVLLACALTAPAAAEYQESPALTTDVTAGKLPPVAQRLPETPLVSEPDRPELQPGRFGGELRMLMGRAQDTRMMVVYGYSRLVRYNAKLELVPDILESVENEGDKVFTLKLRKGHRWSDGHPFTTEDFRYWWEDIANNKSLAPVGPPKEMMPDGQKPNIEVIDDTSIRYSWPVPNPYFLPKLAGASPLYIYKPAHYLKQFHAKYANKAKLEEAVRNANVRGWAPLHNRLDNSYRNDNPDLPTLEPWMLVTRPPADRFVFARNPYFHRVDVEGRQLPYIDRVVGIVADGRLIPPKTGSGESDLQARNISFSDFTFLRRAAKRNDFSVNLWNTARGAHLALYPNLNVSDPAWRALIRDVRFRRALSLAINRHEINQVVYFGLAIEGQNTVLPKSPLYKPEYRDAYAKFNVAEAKRLLDELGLKKRDGRGVRLLPDGRPLEVIVETAGEDTEQTDVLELIHDSWLDAGIKLYSRPLQRDVLRNRLFSGQTIMTIWFGLENGIPTPEMSPEELAPVSQQGMQWPKWGQYHETGGSAGEKIDDPAAVELMDLDKAWEHASGNEERSRIWHRMLAINAEQVYSIGLVASVKQPVVVSNKLRNVPSEGIYNFDPGAFFGIYRPDMFWFADAPRTAAVK